MKLDVFNAKGLKAGKIDVSDSIFAVPVNHAVIQQTLIMQQANRRLGTAATKTRGEVGRSSKKLYSQKHTGRARRGAADSPVMVGGGITFGPHPRSYRKNMPRKMRRLAIRSMLSDKASSGQLKVIDKLDFDVPRTKDLLQILILLGIGDTVLIPTVEEQENLVLSAMNLPGIKTIPVKLINVADMLSYKTILLSRAAVEVIESVWGDRSGENAPKAE